MSSEISSEKSFIRSPKPFQGLIPKPIRRLIANSFEAVQDVMNSRSRIETLTNQAEMAKIHNQKLVTHVLGMMVCHHIKEGEPVDERLAEFRIAMTELPPELDVGSIGFDDEQLELLGKYFEIPTVQEQR